MIGDDMEAGLGQGADLRPVESQHKTATFFHLLFKTLAITTYILCTWFTDNFIMVFVLCVLLLAFDFWTVKNVTGRLMVGLRWWNEVKDDGTSEWVFESKEDTHQQHPTDSLMFWSTLYVTPLIWLLLAIAALISLSFKWLPVVGVALTLSMANLVGYRKCQKDANGLAKKKLTQFIVNRM